jgi:D-alanine-D-alanine ligase
VKPLKVLVLFDLSEKAPADQDYSADLDTPGWEVERDVMRALRKLGHEPRLFGIYDELDALLAELRARPPDIVFNLVEQFAGNPAYDRAVADFLDLAGTKYTGSSPAGLFLCKNKGLAKEILSYHRIRTPAFVVFPRGKPVRRPRRLAFPLFVKPLREEASYGIALSSYVEDDAALEERVAFVHERMKQDALAEEYVDGRELYVSVLGNERLRVFPIRELVFREVPADEPKIATYKAKWDEEYRQRRGIDNVPARDLPADLEAKIATLAKRAYRTLQMRGYGRIDARLTPANELVVLEANPNPHLGAEEDFAQSAKAAGLSYEDLITRILSLGLAAAGVEEAAE